MLPFGLIRDFRDPNAFLLALLDLLLGYACDAGVGGIGCATGALLLYRLSETL